MSPKRMVKVENLMFVNKVEEVA